MHCVKRKHNNYLFLSSGTFLVSDFQMTRIKVIFIYAKRNDGDVSLILESRASQLQPVGPDLSVLRGCSMQCRMFGACGIPISIPTSISKCCQISWEGQSHSKLRSTALMYHDQ